MTDRYNPIKTAWLRQLQADWRVANDSYFKCAMQLPNLELSLSKSVLGSWKGRSLRTLSISIHLIKDHSWETVQEVLYHEMVHQYVEEVLKIQEALPHGAIFKRVCLKNGIDATATGEIDAWVRLRKNGAKIDSVNHKIIDKVNKLFALAQSANPHEAESAMAKAHTLLLKHNLSLLDLQSQSHYIHMQIGDVGRRNAIKTIISAILNKFFFVEAIWTFGYDPLKDISGRVLEIYGTPENVEIAEYVYDYLQNISELSWKIYKRQNHINGNRHRKTFIYGLLNGFYDRMESRVLENASKELIWKGDPQLSAFFRKRNPKLLRSSSSYSKSCNETYRSGKAKGKTLVIHKGIHGKRQGALRFLRS